MIANTEIVILAAGKGTRMLSDQPKVLHHIADKPLLQHVIDTAKHISKDIFYVVVGHGEEKIRKQIREKSLRWVQQAKQLGTGHAVSKVINHLDVNKQVLILYGDVPCLEEDTLVQLANKKQSNPLAILTVMMNDPQGYGRIIRDEKGNIVKIVEEKEATEEEKKIKEVNTGIMLVDVAQLTHWLVRINNDNTQNEYYLTDIIALAVDDNYTVMSHCVRDSQEVQGVNNKQQLVMLERYYQLKQANKLLQKGVTLLDINRFDLRGSVSMGIDVVIDVNVILKGNNLIGNRVSIGANSIIKNCLIGDDVVIHDNCMLDGVVISAHCEIGPFARIRPQTELAEKSKVGNFVEIKKSIIGAESKVNHLSYIGDTTMGKQVNIGAGTITCNYDGAYKHMTTIGDKVFVGSNSALVAPVQLYNNVTIGAGSVITTDVEDDALSLTRSKQRIVRGWKRPAKDIKK